MTDIKMGNTLSPNFKLQINVPIIKCEKHGEHSYHVATNFNDVIKHYCTLCMLEKLEEAGISSCDLVEE